MLKSPNTEPLRPDPYDRRHDAARGTRRTRDGAVRLRAQRARLERLAKRATAGDQRIWGRMHGKAARARQRRGIDPLGAWSAYRPHARIDWARDGGFWGSAVL